MFLISIILEGCPGATLEPDNQLPGEGQSLIWIIEFSQKIRSIFFRRNICSWTLPWKVFLEVMGITGTFGNSMVCLVIARFNQSTFNQGKRVKKLKIILYVEVLTI